MKHNGAILYKNYTNKGHGYDGIKARLTQRLKWFNSYIDNGSCRQKLIKCNVIKETTTEEVKK